MPMLRRICMEGHEAGALSTLTEHRTPMSAVSLQVLARSDKWTRYVQHCIGVPSHQQKCPLRSPRTQRALLSHRDATNCLPLSDHIKQKKMLQAFAHRKTFLN